MAAPANSTCGSIHDIPAPSIKRGHESASLRVFRSAITTSIVPTILCTDSEPINDGSDARRALFHTGAAKSLIPRTTKPVRLSRPTGASARRGACTAGISNNLVPERERIGSYARRPIRSLQCTPTTTRRTVATKTVMRHELAGTATLLILDAVVQTGADPQVQPNPNRSREIQRAGLQDLHNQCKHRGMTFGYRIFRLPPSLGAISRPDCRNCTLEVACIHSARRARRRVSGERMHSCPNKKIAAAMRSNRVSASASLKTPYLHHTRCAGPDTMGVVTTSNGRCKWAPIPWERWNFTGALVLARKGCGY